ncbi:hypothetical protein BJ875DRAFT_546147 [Amylocarpus encephaloides]|uniref:Carrier domain-containing protein n=1 Tax=Amylocarpus encephaloides TaxID=45428 RepID=A0A9P7YC31_9HELO|nr:hypothetical protein BJ875DRAFT_546147 [Amylocarpus encephaloides]
MAFAMLDQVDLTSSPNTIVELFENAARKCPEGTAIQFERSAQATYQELKDMADIVASHFQGLMCKGQLVPVLLPRSIEQIYVILALAKVGAVYVPLDPRSPDTRLCAIITSLQANLVVSPKGSAGRFREANVTVSVVFDPWACIEETMLQPFRVIFVATELVSRDDLAAVLYTSGSTGEPKGVMLSHRNLVEPVRMLSQMEHIDSTTRLFQFASCAFDVHLLDIFCSLFNGATLCQVLARHHASSPKSSMQILSQVFLEKQQVMLKFTFSMIPGALSPLGSKSLHLASSLGLLVMNERERVYATGDYGILTDAGEVRFIGRRDSQIKINGQRVDIAGIKEILAASSINSCVIPIKDHADRMRIYAFVTKEKSYSRRPVTLVQDTTLIKKLHYACRALLPPYMIPKFIVVSAIPLTLSGKVDEQKLSQIVKVSFITRADMNTSTLSADLTPTNDSLGEILASIVAARFSENTPFSDDNLRSYGMTSLDFMVLVNDVKRKFNVSLTFREVFDNPTIRCIAGVLEKKLTQSRITRNIFNSNQNDSPFTDKDQTMPPEQQNSRWIKPSPGQELMFTAQTLLQNHSYSCNFVLRNKSFPLEPERLTSALKVVCSRNEVLRSTYHVLPSDLQNEEGNFSPQICHQKIHPINELSPVCRVDYLESRYKERNLETVLATISKQSRQKFDLGVDSPVRMTLYELSTGGNDWVIHFTIHHIAIDEWAFKIVCRELQSVYHLLEMKNYTKMPLSLPELPQYSEFSRHLNTTEKFDQREEREKWWDSMDFEIFEPFMTELYMHKTTEAPTRLEDDESLMHVRNLDIKEVRLFEAHHCAGSTPFIGWLTLCQIMLGRMTQRSRFALAVPVTDRGMDPKFQDIVGFCLKTLLIPVELAPGDTFESCLNATQQMYSACDQRSLPFEKVVEVISKSRPGKIRPEVMFVYHDKQWEIDSSGSTAVFLDQAENLQLGSSGSRFDLVIHFSKPSPETAHLTFEYRQSLFSLEFIECIARCFEAALCDINSRGTQVSHFQMKCLSTIDEDRLHKWASPPLLSETMERTWIQGNGVLLHELVESMAHESPHTPAIVTTSGSMLSYADLVGTAQNLCQRLIAHGLITQATVLLFINKSAQLVVSKLAVLMGGGRLVVLDPQQKVTINEAKVNIICPDFVIVDSTTSLIWNASSPKFDGIVINVSESEDVPHVQLPVKVSPAEDAYICFSSGSTGSAKCFPISHAAAASSIMSHVERFQLRIGDRVGMVCSTTFDVSMLETFATLAAGGTLCIASHDEFITDLTRCLSSLEVTHVFATPTIVSLLESPAQVPTLRFIALLGEPTTLKLFSLWVGLVDLRNAYGPAEMAMNTHSRKFLKTDDLSRIGQRLGTSMPSVRSYILDIHGNLTLPGCTGDLYIGAREPQKLDQLSRGYISPESMNARYINHSTLGRLYNTGDVCFYTFDGELNLVGRSDDQIKVRGVRINLGDIEQTIQCITEHQIAVQVCGGSDPSLPEPEVCIFVHFPTSPSENQIEPTNPVCSWLLPLSSHHRETLQGVRRHAFERLMDAMVPRFWLPVRYFPCSHNGKLDHKTLKSWTVEFSSHNKKAEYATLIPPRERQLSSNAIMETTLGQTLIQSWKNVFHVSDDNIDTNMTFLRVGGDSISAIRYVSNLRANGIIGCTVSLLYESPTIELLYNAVKHSQIPRSKTSAELGGGMGSRSIYSMLESRDDFLEIRQSIEIEASALGISPPEMRRVYPVTSMQRAMLLQTESHPEIYISQVTLNIHGKLDVEQMVSAWRTICFAHPTMHTTFIQIMSKGLLSFFSVEVEPSTIFELPQINQDVFSPEASMHELAVDGERGFKLGGAMFRLLILEGREQNHKLVFSCHHASCDGWSLSIILRDLANAYQGSRVQSKPSFSDMVDFDTKRDKSAAKAYWQMYLRNDAPTESITSNPPISGSLEMASVMRIVTSISAGKLSEFSQKRNITPVVALQAAWAHILSRMTGTNDVAFGVVVSGRNVNIDGIDEMTGNFLNTVPLRVDTGSNSDLDTMLKEIYQSSVDALEHYHLSLEEIIELSDNPRIFDTVLVFENYADRIDRIAFGSFHLQEISGREFSEIPLSVVLEFVEDGLMITLKFNEALYQVWHVESLIQHYIDIISDIISEAPVAELGQSKPYFELTSVNNTLASVREELQTPSNSSLISLFDGAVQAFPMHVAVEEEATAVTFSQLSEKMDVVSNFLIKSSVCRGSIVPIMFSHSISMVATMLGVMKAGAAYCPIDIESPEPKIRRMLESIGARIIIGDAYSQSKLSEAFAIDFRYICIDEVWQEREKPTTWTEAGVPSIVTPQDPCYVLFTSGSTGIPKGCILSHSAVANAIIQTSSTTGIGEKSRVLLFANYIFDASVVDIFGSLTNGATLCLSPRAKLLSNLESVITERRISYFHSTPTVARVLSPDSCVSLKTLVVGGERMSRKLRDMWADRVMLYDGYGPTECAVQVSTTLLNPWSDVGVISAPLRGNIILLMSVHGDITRIGQIGEVCIGGLQMFSGYLGDAEPTVPTSRRMLGIDIPLFATGDLGRYRPDMTIELLGRNDEQIKLSGERLDVEEVESIICSFEGVQRCAVLAERNQLYALVESRKGTYGPTADQIKQWCLEYLPARLVPLVLLCQNLPLTRSSKLDRLGVIEMFRGLQKQLLATAETQLLSETELSIGLMIAAISGRQSHDATLPLHQSGLNSLDILHLRSSIAKRYGFSLSLAKFWLAENIRSLAQLVDKNLELAHECEKGESPALGHVRPASDSQIAVWMAQNRYSDSTYNVGRVLHFSDIDLSLMYDSLKAVVEFFDIFKITFEWHFDTESLNQRLNSESKTSLELHNLDACKDVLAAVRLICSQDYRRPFNLESGPLSSFRLFTSKAKDAFLYYNIHHVLVDEWTCDKLVTAIIKEYQGLPWKQTIDLSWGTLAAVREDDARSDDALREWKRELSGAGPFDTYSWPCGNTDLENRTLAKTSSLKLPTADVEDFKLQLKDHLSIFQALLSAFQALLHHLIVLIPVSRRGFDAKSLNTIGNMTNTVAIKSDVETEESFQALGAKTAKSINFARENSFVPIEKILGTISSAVAEHSVMFVYNKESSHPGITDFSDMSPILLPHTSTMFDLTLNVVEENDGLSIFVTFNAKRFASSIMEKLAESYLQMLTQIGRFGAGQTLQNILSCMVSDYQRPELPSPGLSTFGGILLHQRFETRAAEAPSSIAIDYATNGRHFMLSYSDLNHKADQIAAILHERYGIVRGDIVPIFLDQTPDILIALIGVLKSGACYTPIPKDGSWPMGRMSQIIQRCQAKVLITDANVVPAVEIAIFNLTSPLAHRNRRPRPVCLATPASPAYILWTSGTTGEPKGVILSHTAALSCIYNISGKLYPKSTSDRVFQFSSPVFDVSVVDYFATLSLGATLCMMPRAEMLTDIQKALAMLRPTAASLTPTVAEMLDPNASGLLTLIVSGEIVSSKLRDMFIGAGTHLINGYGPTESNIVTYVVMNKQDDIHSIGKPFASAQVVILDTFGNIAPTFVRGEIHIGGPHLFSGYQSREDLTARAQQNYQKYGLLYKTGDIGYLDAAGNIIFGGRRDTQIKLHGQRLEPEEISSIMSRISYVQGSAVVLVEGKLVAFVVYGASSSKSYQGTIRLVAHNRKDMDEIRDHVRGKVPAALVPSVWLRISRVPFTISGKLDIPSLSSLVEASPADEKQGKDPPENQYEEKIREICVRTLGHFAGMSANLLDHGLDSYLAMILLSRLRMEFPFLQLSFRDLLANASPRRLAILVRDYASLEARPQLHSRETERVVADRFVLRPHPVSSIQKRFCLAQDIFQDATYNIPGLFETQSISVKAIQLAFDNLVAENSIFRTYFEFDPAKGYQQIIMSDLQVNVSEYSPMAPQVFVTEEQMRIVLQSELTKPFDTASPPLLRCMVFKGSRGRVSIFVNFHHSIMDEQSLDLFITKLSSKIKPAVVNLPKTNHSVKSMQYTTYCIEEQRKLRDTTSVSNSTTFWKNHLQGIETMALPTIPPPQIAEAANATLTTSVSVSKLAFGWAQEQGITNFSVYLTYFQITLARCWDWSEPTVLIPISQRPVNCGDIFGCFLNTVPIHSHIDNSISLETTMENSNHVLLDIMEHSFLPYESILELSGLKSDSFPLMFVYHEDTSKVGDILKDNSRVVRELSGNVKPKFQLTFSITMKREGSNVSLELNIDYDVSKVSTTVIRRLCEHYKALLLSAHSQNKKTAVGDLEILTEEERTLLRQHRLQDTPVNHFMQVYDLIEDRVRSSPDSIACWFEADKKTSYAGLWTLVECSFNLLSQYYTQANARVAIFMEPSVERVAALIGTLKAGFAYVPLDTEWPTLKIAAVLHDCAPTAILVSQSGLRNLTQALKTDNNEMPVIIEPFAQIPAKGQPEGSLKASIAASDLAYVMYTSGTTGVPKGVQVEHGALNNSLDEHCRIYQLSTDSRLLQLAPWTFDVSVVDILATLSRGATLCLGSKDYLLSRLQDAVNLMGITHLATTPTIAALLNPDTSPTLETLAIGGEPMTAKVQRTWANAVRLLNVYGPTETTVNVAYCQVQPDSDVSVIGKSMRNIQLYILNDQLQEVPVGSVGQLAIGGVQLARGYTDEDLSKICFLTHRVFGRIFLTGDLAKFAVDGSVHCLGRRDNQVKLHGQRIEIEEIERLIISCPEVQSTVVLLISTEQFKGICGAFSIQSGAGADAGTLVLRPNKETSDLVSRLDHLLRLQLPQYSVPRRWVPLSRVPTLPNGKVDRTAVHAAILALSKRELENFAVHRMPPLGGGRALESKNEKLLGISFGEVLGSTDLCKESNFFNLSGDSISAIRLCSAASYHGLRIMISDIYKNPTLEQLASVAKDTYQQKTPSLTPGGEIHHTPVMEWFFGLRKKNPDWYNQNFAIKLKSLGDLGKIPSAWETIIRTHPMLSTKSLDGASQVELLQPFPKHAFHVSRQKLESFSALLDGIVDMASGLSLATGRVSSLGLFNISGDGYCVFCVHHLVIDIVSWQIVFDDLSRLLRGGSILPELGTFQAWSQRVQERRLSPASEATRRNSKAAIQQRHSNSLIAPSLAKTAHLNVVATAKVVELRMPEALTKFLLSDANRYTRTEPVDILLTSLILAFKKWKGIQEIEICLESHGRDLKDETLDLSRTVGWFTSMTYVIFSVNSHAEEQLGELITEVKDKRTSVMAGVDLTDQFSKREDEVPVVTFNYHGSYSTNNERDCFDIIDIGEARADEDPENLRFAAIDAGCGINNGVLTLNLIYSTSIHKKIEAEELLTLWKKSLETTLDYCKVDTNIDMLTSREVPSLLLQRHQLAALVDSSLKPVGVEPFMVENIVLATDMQKGMVLASREFGSYMESFTYSIQGPCEPELFFLAWLKVAEKHAAARSIFIMCDVADTSLRGEVLQVILSPDNLLPSFRTGFREFKPLRFDYGKATMQIHLHQTADGSSKFTWEYHHALIDGWSAGILMRDFQSAYLDRLGTAAVSFERVRTRLASSAHEQKYSFWKSELKGAKPNRLYDHSQSKTSQNKRLVDQRHDQTLSGMSQDRIKACAAAESTTVSTLLRAAWILALSYFCGDEEIIFGATVSGRNVEVSGIEEIVGPCVNTVPFRIQVDNCESRESFIRRVHLKSAALVQNDEVSLHKIYEVSGKKDLFDSTFVYQNYAKSPRDPDLPFTMKLLEAEERTDIPLNVMVSHTDSDELHVAALLHGEKFCTEFLSDLFAAFAAALSWVSGLHNPVSKVKDLALLSTTAKHRVESISLGPLLYHQGLTVWELFAHAAGRAPEKTALEFYISGNIEVMSYRSLFAKAETLARYIYLRGTRDGDKVAVYMDKSPMAIIVMLSLLRLGAICVPIRFSSPNKRIESLMQEATPKLVILFEKDARSFSESWDKLYVEQGLDLKASGQAILPESTSAMESIAMILFTSGTSGTPKGVFMPNRQVAGYATAMAEAYRYDLNSRVFSFANYTFDVFITDVFGALSAGALVCLAPQIATVDNLTKLLNQSRSTHVNLTSSVASILTPDELPHLQYLVLTGEPATGKLYQTWVPRVRVTNSYGPTEAAVVTFLDVTTDTDPQCVGNVVSGMEVLILDDWLRRVPIGVAGSIYTSGNQLSLGYLDRPEQTAKLFVPNPYSPGRLMYNTGDSGAFDSRGRVLCLDRKDQQVKINGQRVELSEIEEALGSDYRVFTTAIFNPIVKRNQVIAFFEFEVADAFDLKSQSPEALNAGLMLRARARQSLPSYMVPSAFIPVEQLRLTSNGKIDRANLRQLFLDDFLPGFVENDSPAPIRHSLETVSETESKLLNVVIEFSGISSLSVDTDLFAGVLDSLTSMSLAGRLRKIFQTTVLLQWVLDSSTIRDLASRIDSGNQNKQDPLDSSLDNFILQMPPTTTFSHCKGRNIFCIHGASGLSYVFHGLSSILPEFNVIGINDPHYGDRDAYRDVAEMTDLYLKTILHHQTRGHFVLLGYSFGAHIAVEIARSLHDRHFTAQLILVDSSVEPGSSERFRSPESAAAVYNSFKIEINDVASTDEEKEFLQRLEPEVTRNLRLMTGYQMEYFPWTATFLRACSNLDEERRNGIDISNGYGAFVKSLRVERISGDHYNVFSDGNISFNGAVIRRALGLN